MPDFSKYSNYTEQTAFSGIRFGANAPVLEVELNELQQILDTKLKRMSLFMGNTVFAMSNGSINFDTTTKVLTLTNCVAVAYGLTALIPSASVTLSDENTVAYIKVEEVDVTHESPLTEYGNTEGAVISNPIIDTRVGVETSRRRAIKYVVKAGNILPKTIEADTCQYVQIGVLSKDTNEFVLTNLGGTISDIVKSIDEKIANIPQNTITSDYNKESKTLSLHFSYAASEYDEKSKTLSLNFSTGGGIGTLPVASATNLGAVKIGSGINVAPDGTISTDVETQAEAVAEIVEAGMTEMSDDTVDDLFDQNGDGVPD